MLSDNKVVLVVENEISVCLYVAELLEDNNFVVFTATSVEEALKILNVSNDIDLLITDIDLGGNMSGIDLANSARKMFAALPVIFVTGTTKTGNKLSNTRFLIKPYDDDALLTSIKEIITE